MSLKNQAISGVKWTATASVTNAIVQLLQLAILTRFLEPTDFGLMAIVMVVISFSQMFVDMGVSNAIIYKDVVSKEQLSSLYWLNVFFGIFIFFILFSTSFLIAEFYNDLQLVPLIKLVAVTFLIKPWGQQFMILLQKKLKFHLISKVDIFSRLASFIVVIILALNNFGVFALAYGALVYTILTTIGYNIFGRKFHKPQLYFKLHTLNEFISFGLFQMGENILKYFSAEFDTILIGKLLGLETLGIYNVAKNLVTKPYTVINPIITKVTFPLMSTIKGDIAKLRSVFLKILNNLAYVNIPVYLMISLLANPLVLILFGDDWLQAVPIIQILSFTYMLRAMNNPSGSLLLSQGKANIAFYWKLSVFALYPSSIIIGSYFGIIGVTLATLILQILLFFPNWRFIVYKTCKADVMEYGRSILIPLFFVLIPAFFAKLLTFFISNNYIQVALALIVFTGLFLLLINKYNTGFFNEVKNLIFVSARKRIK